MLLLIDTLYVIHINCINKIIIYNFEEKHIIQNFVVTSIGKATDIQKTLIYVSRPLSVKIVDVLLNGHSISVKGESQSLCCTTGK